MYDVGLDRLRKMAAQCRREAARTRDCNAVGRLLAIARHCEERVAEREKAESLCGCELD
jgi:hypothetical protein